ncbi:MAG TPA: glycosyltransferase family 2 protein [Bryobacterales bacterium]|nr:glycosyltransferase family 2 protein [Bryobacterales bacterium]
MPASVSFIIPNWNHGDLLAAALASIRAQTLAPLEVLVADNGSADDSIAIAEGAGAKVLPLGRNTGFSFAVNRGLEAARGELVVILNNDVELSPGWTETLARAVAEPGRWFAIGKLVDHARRDRIDGVGDAICRGGAACRLGHGRPDGPLFDTPRCTFFPSATALLARREFFDRAGLFDEAFFAYLEDVDLGLRAALLNLPGVYVPEAVAYHRASSTLGARSPAMVQALTRNQILLLAKFYPAGLRRRFWRPIVVAQALWALLALRHGHPLAYARGLLAGLKASAAVHRGAAGRWSGRDNGNELANVLMRSEAEVARFARAAGWDAYWRWYFRLAGSAGAPESAAAPQEPAR